MRERRDGDVAVARGSRVPDRGAPGCDASSEQPLWSRGAVDRGPGAAFDQRSASGDAEGVPGRAPTRWSAEYACRGHSSNAISP